MTLFVQCSKNVSVKLSSRISFTIFKHYRVLRNMKSRFFKFLASINKYVLPSFTKQKLDLAKAKKWQLAIIGWRAYVTKQALD